jgi:hypothetical protein
MSQLYGNAAPDTFHGYVQSSVSVTQLAGGIPFCNSNGPISTANLSFTENDDFLFHGTPGTVVAFELTANLDSVLTATSAGDCSPGQPQPADLASLQMLSFGARMFDPLVHSTCGTGVGSEEMSFTGTFHSTIGANSIADFAVQTIFNLQSADSLPSYQTASSENIADASNTASISVQVLTPGVTFSSGSGALYLPTSSVPEPPSFLLFGSGLMGLGILKRRRRA